MKDFSDCFKSGRQDSFRAILKNIGQPKQIRLKLDITGDDNEKIKWHLNHVIIQRKKSFFFINLFFLLDRID
jgi:hypothetical protein